MGKMIKKKKLLLTGASGFLGWNICGQAPEEWEIYGSYFSHPITRPNLCAEKVDLRNFKALKNFLKTINPAAVIHAAAVTDPNYCQLHQTETKAITS